MMIIQINMEHSPNRLWIIVSYGSYNKPQKNYEKMKSYEVKKEKKEIQPLTIRTGSLAWFLRKNRIDLL